MVRSPATARRGFTVPEVLIAAVLMLMVLGLSLTLWLDAGRNVTKGEDALAAVQDASSVMRRLRKDLGRLAVNVSGRPWQLRYVHLRGRSLTTNTLVWDESARGFSNAYSRSDNPGAIYRHDLTELSFYVLPEGEGVPVKVTYIYQPERKFIQRQEGFGRPQRFALPKLQDFRIALLYDAGDEVERSLLGSQTEFTGALLQLWFRVHFVVRSDDPNRKIRATAVELDSLIFPHRFHKDLRVRWKASR